MSPTDPCTRRRPRRSRRRSPAPGDRCTAVPGDRCSADAGEGGFVAGGEAVVLGVLVFVVGTLLMVSAWILVDSSFAAQTAAREATRAVVESPATVLDGDVVSVAAARGVATDAAIRSLTAQKGPADGGASSWSLVAVDLDGRYARCGELTATVRITVDTPRLPFLGRRLAATEVRGSHTERIEPYRAGLPAGGMSC